MRKLAFSLFGYLSAHLADHQPAQVNITEDPHADWHNGPHGDVILVEWQRQHLQDLGYNTSTYNIDYSITNTRGLQAEGTFTKWSKLNSDGKIIVPYYLEDTVTENLRQTIHDELADFSYSLGCIEMVYDPDLSNGNGLYVLGETSVDDNGSGSGCWSYVGMCPNCKNGYSRVEAGWQALRLPDWCIGQGGVHHEFLHAIGLLHEQDRPDFEDHFEYSADGGSITQEGWFNTGHTLEPSSNLMYSGFKLKNGRSYSSHDLLTTTDAVQVWKQYCEADFFQFPLPNMTTCPTPDVVDAIRPVFVHRLCDSRPDCLGLEDEGSELVRCESDLNSVGCCSSVYMSLFGHECVDNGIVNGKVSYLCPNGNQLRWENGQGWYNSVSVGGGSYYSISGLFDDNSGTCVHEKLSDPDFVWGTGHSQQVYCVRNGEKTLLPCAYSDCDFTVSKCMNSIDGSGFTCVCRDDFQNCDGEDPTEPPTEPPETTEMPETTPESTTSDPGNCKETIEDSWISCDKGHLIIDLPLCALQENNLDPSAIFMGTQSCRGEVIRGYLVFDAQAKGCSVNPDKSNDKLIFNTVVRTAGSNSVITRSPGLELLFSCVLNTTQTISLDDGAGLNVNVNHIYVDFGEEQGSFDIEMAVFNSSDFAVPANLDHVFHVSDNVFIAISNWYSPLFIAIEKCVAFPEDRENQLEYVLIKNSCELDAATTILSSGSSPIASFQFEAFQFTQSTSPISIECEISVCEADNCNVCENRRRRRSLNNSHTEKIKATIIAQP